MSEMTEDQLRETLDAARSRMIVNVITKSIRFARNREELFDLCQALQHALGIIDTGKRSAILEGAVGGTVIPKREGW